MNTEAVKVSDALADQLKAVRASGVVNMLDRREVKKIAREHRYWALSEFCDRTDGSYGQAMLYGITTGEWQSYGDGEEQS